MNATDVDSVLEWIKEVEAELGGAVELEPLCFDVAIYTGERPDTVRCQKITRLGRGVILSLVTHLGGKRVGPDMVQTIYVPGNRVVYISVIGFAG